MAVFKEEIMLAMNSEALYHWGIVPQKGCVMVNDIFAVLPTGFRKGAHNMET